MITLKISAQAMSTIEGSEISNDPEKYDPGSQGAKDAYDGLGKATRVKFGRGFTYVMETTVAGAETIADYCETVGEGFASETEAEIRAEGRVLLTAAQRIRFQIGKQS